MSVCRTILAVALFAAIPKTWASAEATSLNGEQRRALQNVVRESTNRIWFEQNAGQFPQGVRYGFRTSFGQTLVYDDHLQLVSRQVNAKGEYEGRQVVDVRFPGSNPSWSIEPGGASDVAGTYQTGNGTALHPQIFNEVTLRNVYDGVDLRLYSADKGTLEFDWIVARAEDYAQIRIAANGQDGLAFNDDGSATLQLRYQDLSFKIPESYQLIDGKKAPVTARMVAGDNTAEIRYAIAENLVNDQPLVIDPNVVWATYFDLNDSTTPFDSYLYAIAINTTGVYCLGWMVETCTNATYGPGGTNYMEVNAGFSQGTAGGQNYIYRFSPDGLHITAWTSTGTGAPLINGNQQNTTPPTEMELFPDGRVLAAMSDGTLQIYSANLATQSYTGKPEALSTINSLAIVDNNSFYVGGLVTAGIPALIPAGSGLDTTFAGTSEGIIVRYTLNAGTPVADWATYIGGDNTENFCAIALTPDNTKLCFAVHSNSGTAASYPAVVNAVDATLTGTTTVLIGVINEQAAKPATFNVFSFLGGSTDDGLSANKAATCLVTATNTGFWVAGNTASANFPGTTVALGGAAAGSQTTNGGGTSDCFVSFIPINGSAGTGFQSTYIGGTAAELIGGLAYDAVQDRVLTFGTTGAGFPTLNTSPTSNYFNSVAAGGLEIFIATFNGALTVKDYATYISGNQNDYLGDTGLLRGAGHVKYSTQTDQFYLGTTVHSDLTGTIISKFPGKDQNKSNTTNDTHAIFAFTLNRFDFGDAPASYEQGDPAAEAISNTIRIGLTVDAEPAPLNSPNADGDDLNNSGSANDEDGITLPLPQLNFNASTYSVNVSVFNNTGSAHTLQGWIDFNRNGIFDAGERATVNVPTSASQQTVTLTWNGLSGLVPGKSFLRLRFSDNALITTPTGTDTVGHGEIEDYLLPIVGADPSVVVDDGSTTYTAGTNVSYTITVNNAGPSDAQTVLLSDPLPPGVTFVSLALPAGWTRTDGTLVGANGTITATIPTLTAGVAPQVFTLVVHVPSNASGNLVNTATISSATPDTNAANNTSTDTDTPTPSADLSILKDDSSTTYTAGNNISYSITVNNAGPSDAQTLTMSDPLPAGITFVSLTLPAGWARTDSTAVGANGTITATRATLAAGAAAQVFTLVVHVPSGQTGNLANTATISSTTPDSNAANNSSTDTDTPAPLADVSIVKDDGSASFTAGSNVSYSITINNAGPSDAQGLSMSDVLPAGTTFVSLTMPAGWTRTDGTLVGANGTITATRGTLAASAPAQVFTLVVHVASNFAVNLVNTATISSTTPDSNAANNSSTDTDTPAPLADISISKDDGSTTYTAGTNVSYTITVNNAGPSDAQGLTMSDALPAGTTLVSVAVPAGWTRTDGTLAGANGTITATRATLVAGAAAQVFTLVVHVASNVTGNLSNTATITSGTPDATPGNNSSTDTDTPAPSADVSIVKDDSSLTYTAGTDITYHLTVNNVGPSDAQGLNVSDALPAGMTFVSLTLPANWTRTDGTLVGANGTITATRGTLAAGAPADVLTLVVHVASNVTGNLANTATISTTTPDGNAANNSSTDTDTPAPLADLSILKDDSSATYTAGTNVSYAITVNNAGPSDAQALTMSDALPLGTTFVSLALPAGWTRTDSTAVGANGTITATQPSLAAGAAPQIFTLVVHVNSNVTGNLANTATIASTTPDDNAANNSSTDTDTPAPLADLSILKSDSSATYTAGTNVSYAITVNNAGPSDAQSLTMSDTLPIGTTFVSLALPAGWTRTDGTLVGANGTITATQTSLAAGAAPQIFTLVVHVNSNVSGNLANTATISSTTPDSNAGNNSSTDTDTPAPLADVSILKDDSSATYTAGTNVSYAITVNNAGPSDAQTLSMSDVLPAGTTFVSLAVPAGWTRTDGTLVGANGTITATRATLAAGAAPQVFTLVVHVNSNVTGNLANTSTISTATPDGNAANNSSTDTDTPNPQADLQITKTDGVVSAVPGTPVTYTIVVTNAGPSDVIGASVADVFLAALTSPTFTAVQSGGATGFSANGSGNINDTVNMPKGSTITYTATATIDPSATGSVSNTATVTPPAGVTDPTPGNNSATDTDSLLPQTDLALAKSASTLTPILGQTITYTITLTNNGPANATNAVVSDPLPAGLTFVSATPSIGTSYNPGAQTWSVPALNSGANVTLLIQATVNTLGAKINTATITSVDQPDPTPGNNSASVTVTPQDVDLVVTKTDNSVGGTVVPGQTLTYTLTVKNTGNVNASGVVLHETIPPNTTFVAAGSSAWLATVGGAPLPNGAAGGTLAQINIGNVAAGAAALSFTFVVKVNNTVPSGVVSLANTTTVNDDASHGPDFNPADNTATDTVNVSAAPDLSVIKTDNSVGGTVVPGQTFTYSLTVQNVGNQDATGVVLYETVPANTTFVTAGSSAWLATVGGAPLPNGAAAGTLAQINIGNVAAGAAPQVFTFVVTVNNPVPAGVTSIANTATVNDDGSNGPDPTPANNTGNDTVTLNAQPDLTITNTDGVLTAVPGQTLIYTLVVSNVGNQNSTGVFITNPIPANATFVNGSSTPGWSFAGGVGTFNVGNLAAGANTTVLIAYQVNATVPAGVGTIFCTASVDDDHANGLDPTPANNTASDTDTLNAAPDLKIVKDDGLTTLVPGQLTIYTLTISNVGNQDATGVFVNETVPLNTTFDLANSSPGWGLANGAIAGSTATLTIGNLAAGANLTRTFAVRVTATVPSGATQIVNTATIDDDHTNGADPNPANNSSTDTDMLAAQPDLSIVKDDGVAVTNANALLVYTLTVRNVGNQDATGVVVNESVPANTTFDLANSVGAWGLADGAVAGMPSTLTLGNLAAGATTTLKFAVHVDASVPAGVTTISNTASVDDDHSNGVDPTPGNNSSTDTDTLSDVPDLKIVKDDGVAACAPGDTLMYTLTISNVGTKDSTGVFVSETIPPNTTYFAAGSSAGWTFANGAIAGTNGTLAIGSLAAGANTTRTIVLHVNNTVPSGASTIANTASVDDDHANGVDPNPANNTSTDTDTLNAAPDLSITKDDGVASLIPGQLTIYTLTVSNVGNQDATGVFVSETVPLNTTFDLANSAGAWTFANGAIGGTSGSVTIGNLAAGASVTLKFAVLVNATVPSGVTQIANTATVDDDHSNGADPAPGNNSATDTDVLVAQPDLKIVKDDGLAALVPGQLAIYTLTLSNVGNQDSTGVFVNETVPANTTFDLANSSAGWGLLNGAGAGSTATLTVGNLAAGATITRTFAVRVNATVPSGATQIANTATIDDDHSNGVDPNPADNTSTDTDTLNAQPDLTITKDDGVAVTNAGQLLVYTLTVRNTGNQDATGVFVAESVPANTTFDLPNSVGNWGLADGAAAGTPSMLILRNLAAGATVTLKFAVHVDATVPAGVTQISNTASVDDDHSNGADPTPGNNSSTDTDTLTDAPDLKIVKDDGVASAQPGDLLTYTLTISNVGTKDSTGVVVSETIPPNTTYVAAGSSAGWSFVNGAAAGTNGTLLIGSVAAGANVSRTIILHVNNSVPAGVAAIVNTATVDDDHSNGVDPDPSNNTSTDTDTLIAQPDLTLTKDDGVTTAQPGNVLTYALVVKNVGNQDATGVVIHETVPANTFFVAASSTGSWSFSNNDPAGTAGTLLIGNLAAGATVTFNFAVQINATVPAGANTIVNTATVNDDGTNGADPTPLNNSATDTDTLIAQPDLAITKDDGVLSCVPGDTLTYTLTVNNHGNQDATGVVITETVPAGTTFVAVGSSVGWTLANGATGGSSGTLLVGNLATGASAQFTFVVKVNATVAAGVSQVVNTASVDDDHSNGVDPTPDDNSATDTDVLNAQPDLKIVKSDGGLTVAPGNTLVYTLTYSNVGNQDATGVFLSETVPANCTFVSAGSNAGWTLVNGAVAGTSATLAIGNLAAGASGSATFVINLNASIPAGTTSVLNTASIDDDHTNGVDPNPGDNTSTVSTHIPMADLKVVKTVDNAAPPQLGVVSYTVTVSNLGPDGATGVTISDTLPAGLDFIAANASQGSYDNVSGIWTVGAVANISSATLSVQAKVAVGTANQTIVNTATISSNTTYDPDGSNNTSTSTIVPLPCPMPTFVSAPVASPSPAMQGQAVSFSVAASDTDGRPQTYTWNFGDGSTGSGPAPQHTYSAPGHFTVVVASTNDCGGAATANLGLDVVPVNCTSLAPAVGNPPTITATLVQNGMSFNFTASATDVEDGVLTAISWDFGDGSFGFGTQVSHTYATTDMFFVTAHVTDKDGNCRQVVLVVNPTQTATSNVQPLSCTLLHVHAMFNKTPMDKMTFAVTLLGLPAGFKTAHQPIMIQIAGLSFNAVLDGHGMYHDAQHAIQTKNIGTNTILTFKVSKSEFKQSFKMIVNANVAPETIPGMGIGINLGGSCFAGNVDVTYSSKINVNAELNKK
ncbi:MAG TPA: PKD domain-containing protein [Planctomycetota bacterium]|nr:PKD domain-containing protein [Planctomycetota bacterium]